MKSMKKIERHRLTGAFAIQVPSVEGYNDF
jgi:hypothetical protein